MEFTQDMYYVGHRSFKSKDGKQFNIVSLVEQGTAPAAGSVSEMFIDAIPEICNSLQFLDRVSCQLELESMGSKPRLKTIIKRIATPKWSPVPTINR